MDFNSSNIFTSNTFSYLKPPIVIKPSDLGKNRFLSSAKLDYNPNKYLYIHTVVVPSTKLEKNGFHIKPGHEFSNTWSDSIPEDVLEYFSPTFKISHIYLEHVHIPQLRKGRVVDYNLYKMNIGKSKDVLVADCLLALELKHKDLVKMCLDGSIGAVSQGCFSDHLTCSKCGNVVQELEQACDHVHFEGNSWFKDENGITRLVSNLLGSTTRDTSFSFFDVSLVMRPSFYIAVFRDILNHNKEQIKKKADDSSVFDALVSMFGSSDNSVMPSNKDSEIPLESLFVAYTDVRDHKDMCKDYAELLLKSHGSRFLSSDTKCFNFLNFMRAYEEYINPTKLSLNDKINSAIRSSAFMASTPKSREIFISEALKMPASQFSEEVV